MFLIHCNTSILIRDALGTLLAFLDRLSKRLSKHSSRGSMKGFSKNSLPRLSWWWVVVGGDGTVEGLCKDCKELSEDCKDFLRDSLRTLGGWWLLDIWWWVVVGFPITFLRSL